MVVSAGSQYNAIIDMLNKAILGPDDYMTDILACPSYDVCKQEIDLVDVQPIIYDAPSIGYQIITYIPQDSKAGDYYKLTDDNTLLRIASDSRVAYTKEGKDPAIPLWKVCKLDRPNPDCVYVFEGHNFNAMKGEVTGWIDEVNTWQSVSYWAFMGLWIGAAAICGGDLITGGSGGSCEPAVKGASVGTIIIPFVATPPLAFRRGVYEAKANTAFEALKTEDRKKPIRTQDPCQ